MSDGTILRILVAGQSLILGALVAVLVLKVVLFRVTVRYLESAAETLAIVKEWCTLAHTQTRNAARVLDKVENSSAPVIAAVEKVPEQTAEKVTAALRDASESGQALPALKPDSGRNRVPQPPAGGTA